MAEDNAVNAETKGSESSQAKSPLPSIAVPKGGGAIRSIGEKFTANPVSGTGSMSVPIATSPGRSGFGPQLSLSYDSGAGNGPFGVGWTLSAPSITRKTDKGLPSYRDAEESDVYILSGSEDLVPVLEEDGRRFEDHTTAPGYLIHRYRPRIEGLFARIERWTSLASGEIHWRSLSKDNLLTLYGFDADSRVGDPLNPAHVFRWLICRSYDDKGNAMVYEYLAENDDGIDPAKPSERNRMRSANRYLKRIRYGNRTPLLLDPDRPSFRRCHIEPHDPDSVQWLYEALFDYGEGHYCEEEPDQDGRVFAKAGCEALQPWPVRRDPFSSYRSGFEIRTSRLCRRVLMFHHFPQELGVDSLLVRSTSFHYREKPIGSFICQVVQSGHALREDGRYLTRSLPSLDLSYSTSPLEDPAFGDYRVQEVDEQSLDNLPGGIDDKNYRWVDLDGEGISGVLSEQGDAWFYKPNLGEAHFGAVETVQKLPAIARLNGSGQTLMDVTGHGRLDLVDLSPPLAGFQERTAEAGWEGFRAFASLPVRDWSDPNLRFTDLTGDGIADVLVTDGDTFTWHPSLLRDGFGEGRRAGVPVTEETGPRVVFADPDQSVYLADITGDGLSDILRIRNGEVCYWPNLGYGRFGAKITMDNAPRFDRPDLFDQRRIRLADIDGSGTSDILYLGSGGVAVFLNESGNGWSSARYLRQFPAIDDLGSVMVADFLGRGTSCVLWSSPLPGAAGRQLRYVDLMCGEKPHLMTRTVNNLGAETRIEYASSTEFYLADKLAGTPWVSKLPFPVHLVKRVETYDYLSRNRFVSRYSYHHGFYDGIEREFRGFGRVDQYDTEEFAALTAKGNFPAADNIHPASDVPPTLSKTWFHTGVFPRGRSVSRHLAHEYYREGAEESGEARLSPEHMEAMLLNDTILPGHLTPEEAREACRSLKGAVLRQEVYALDGKEQSCRPYTVSESNYTIRTLQKRGINRHAVFFTHAREALSFNYERKLYRVDGCRRADPRVSHGVTLAVDDFGNVLTSVAVAYGRRFPELSAHWTEQDRHRQTRTLLTLTESRYTNAVSEADAYRAPLPAETRLFELIGLRPSAALPGVTNLFRFGELAEKVAVAGDGGHELPFEDWRATGAAAGLCYRRLLKQSRTRFRSNRLDRLLPVGSLEALALPGESYQLALTPGLLASVYRREVPGGPPEALLPDPASVLGSREGDGGGYLDLDGDGRWWIPGGRMFFDPDPGTGPAAELQRAIRHYFLPRRFEDPFGFNSRADFDVHDLLITRTTDAVGNSIEAEIDYRVLQPARVTDPNGNRSLVAFDALGMVAGSALMGKVSEQQGDSLQGLITDPSRAEIERFLADPTGPPRAELLADATTRVIYDLERFARTRKAHPDSPESWQPSFASILSRETHLSDLAAGEQSRIQVSFSYSDGFEREIQKKIQAEPGPVEVGGPSVDPRWVGSGWTIFNNKGKPVRQFEPFFSDSNRFEFGLSAGVSPILFYDPTGRVVTTAHPNFTYEKAVFDPWQQSTWDVNDTVLLNPKNDPDVAGYFEKLPDSDCLPTWYQRRIDGGRGHDEKRAADKAAKHAGTPTIAHFDTLGRAFLTIADNGRDVDGADRLYRSYSVLDIEGLQRQAVDALGRTVVQYDYDLPGTRIHQQSMEAGERWTLSDVAGKPVRAWNSRRYDFRIEYDGLRRPLNSFVSGGDSSEQKPQLFAREILHERTIYGDSTQTGLSEPQQRAANLRGKPFRHFDSTGVVSTDLYDFKGNLLSSSRQFSAHYQELPDWSGHPALEPEVFTGSTAYDALNRAVSVTAPDKSVYRPTFNEANLQETVEVYLRGAATATGLVTNIDYNSKGQRVLIEYGNSARTRYGYDPETFRLVHLQTTRGKGNGPAAQIFKDPAKLQELDFFYDPIGNITRIADGSLQTVFNDNQRVDPACDYGYDPIYRLVEATGREQVNQSAFALKPAHGNYRDYPFVGAAQPGNLQALRNYREKYAYDPAGNFRRLTHQAENGNWTRSYDYDEESLIEPGKTSNRLSRTALHSDPGAPVDHYRYDAHGSMTQMPHLTLMQWDVKDQLFASSRQRVNDGPAETTFYAYDATAQRARKVTERPNGTRKNERLYLGGFEIYREYAADGATVTLARETLHVMDNKQRIALVETKTVEDGNPKASPISTQRYQFGNHLGSVGLELDHAGGLLSYEEYTPYGSSSFQAGASAAEVSLKRYRYTGRERDEETGFSYHGARYYPGWLGRWLSCDPAGMVDGSNLYRYARNSPVCYSDASGRDPDGANEEQVRKDDERLKAIGVTRQQVIDFVYLPRGDFVTKYGGGTIRGELSFWWNFPSDKVRALPGDLLGRVLPQQDQTVYLHPSGRIGTNASETPQRVKEMQPPSGTGAIVATTGYVITGQYDPRLQALGDNVEGVASGFAAAGQARAANKALNPSLSDPRPTQWGAPTDPAATQPKPSLVPAFPMLDAASVKSTNWSDKKALSDVGDNYYRWGIPDTPDALVGIAKYDAQGNVYLRVYKSDLSTLVTEGKIGTVSLQGLPGKFGDSAFGVAIESRVNTLITQSTGQPHIEKHGAANGVDFSPKIPPQQLRAPAANDNAR
jgi:RHS repeat-associated protein